MTSQAKLIEKVVPADQPISIDLNNADLVETLRSFRLLEDGKNGNLAIGANIAGSLKLNVARQPARKILASILDAHELKLVDRHGVVWVEKRIWSRNRLSLKGLLKIASLALSAAAAWWASR